MQTNQLDSLMNKLDKNSTNSFYWSLTLLATLGGFLFGYDTANIGSVLNFIPYHLGSLALGYLVAGASLGAAIGALAAGPITDRFGRKSILVFDAGLYALGAILSAFTVDAGMLLIARTLIGLAVGADSAIATAYIAEYAPKDKRGKLSILQQWMITVGILSSYLIAAVILSVFPKFVHSIDWRVILGLGAVPALFGLALRSRMPESPRWLLEHNQYDKLHKILKMLNIETSLDQIKMLSIQNDMNFESKSSTSKSSKRGIKKALLVASVFMIFQQLTGINIPLYYGPKILTPFFAAHSSTVVASAIQAVEATAVLAAILVASEYLAFRYIDRFGRKYLAKIGFGGMAFFMAVAALGVSIFHGGSQALVMMIGFGGFLVFFSWGVGGTGWIIQGEYFPTPVRGRMAATVATADWLANFVLIQIFPLMDKSIGLAGVMIVFSALSLLAVLFVVKMMPETKGLSVEEIAELFEAQAR